MCGAACQLFREHQDFSLRPYCPNPCWGAWLSAACESSPLLLVALICALVSNLQKLNQELECYCHQSPVWIEQTWANRLPGNDVTQHSLMPQG